MAKFAKSPIVRIVVVILLSSGFIDGFKLVTKSKRYLSSEELFHENGKVEGDKGKVEERVFFQDTIPQGVVKVKAGSSVSLECEAGGSPTPTVHWLFDNGRIPQGSRHNVFDDAAIYELTANSEKDVATLRMGNTKSRLFIDCVTPSHAGTYTCVAETPTKKIITSGIVEVESSHADKSSMCSGKRDTSAGKVPARIYMWTSQRLEFEGSDAQLFCRAEGSPAPSLAWYSPDDHLITAKDDRYVLLENGDLVIRGISWQDMGLYRCVAENELGTDEASIFVYPTAEE